MKTTKKLVCIVLSVLFFSVATTAFAANITFTNSLDLRMSLTLTYYDADTGAMTTQGWWHVEPGGQTVVTVNADASRDIYYAAYNKEPFLDSSTRGNPQVTRWASPRTFKYSTDAEPSGELDIWQGYFYRIDGGYVNIDVKR